MKHVLILSASPRKNGNSDTLCDRFAQGASESGHKVEKIFLASKDIGYCRGCGVCNSTHKCVQKDDMSEILDKMVTADVIVLATPVYFYTMDGQMKTFIDRTVPRYTEITNKDFYFIPHPLIVNVAHAAICQEHIVQTLEAVDITGTGENDDSFRVIGNRFPAAVFVKFENRLGNRINHLFR